MTSFHNKGGLRIATLLCFFFLLGSTTVFADYGVRPGYQVVSRAEIVEAMRQCGNYDPTATTNGARFQGDLLMILYLAQKARERAIRRGYRYLSDTKTGFGHLWK